MDHVPVVKRVHEHESPLRHDLAQPLLAIREGDALLDHFGAQGTGRGHLRRICVLGDQDQGRHADRRRRERHRLGVVARADGDHAPRARIARDEGQDGVEGATRLERPGHLEALRLKAQRGVEVGGQRGRAPDVVADPSGRLAYLLGMLVEKVRQAAAESGSTADSRRGARRRFTSRIPARITMPPATTETLTVSFSRKAPQKTAVTGTR